MKFVSPTACPGIRGTVTLVSLCFVAVMGITLAGYIAVCSRAMNLSNRTFQNNLSSQLAEVGVDEALRAFNKNDWSGWASNPTDVTGGTTAWTLDTTNKRATRTITFNSPKLGQGVTGTIKLRVDNYDANQLDSAWSNSANYRINDLVGYNGIWYRCIQNHSNQTPGNLAYWVQAPIPWAWSSNTAYTTNSGSTNNSMIVNGSTWYYCNTSHTSGSTWSADAAKWTAMDPPTLAWAGSTAYSLNQQVYYTGDDKWYRCKTAHTSTSSFDAAKFDQGTVVSAWRWQNTHTYAYNQVVYYNQTWYRCIVPSSTGNAPGTSDWENALTGMHGWSSSLSYNLGDAVYSGSSWYRCIQANTNKAPASNAAYWSAFPNLSRDWDSGRQYSQYDTVRYNGVRYLSLQNSNSGLNPATATTYWVGANTGTASYQWNSATAYSAGDYRCYGGVWYKCTAATTANANHTPNNTSYWNAAWANSFGVTTGAPVVYAQGIIAIAGSPSITTQLRAPIAPAPLFPNALGAATLINLPMSATVDSYDSTLGTYNQTTSPFSVASPNIGSAAVLAGGLTTSTAVTVTSARVNGYVAAPSASTAPYAPRWSYGGTAILTNILSPTVPSPRVDLTRVSRSPDIPQFDIQTVAGGTALTVSGAMTIGTPGATTPSIYNISGNLDRTAASDILTIVGPVILNVTGRLYIDPSALATGKIIIANSGSAEIHFGGQLYVGGTSTTGIQNLTTDPKKCILIGTSISNTSSSHYYWATYPFYGVIYMPNAYVSTWNNVPIYGAISAKNIAFPQNGGALHYDTSLRYTTINGVDQPYTVSEWRELPVTEAATMP